MLPKSKPRAPVVIPQVKLPTKTTPKNNKRFLLKAFSSFNSVAVLVFFFFFWLIDGIGVWSFDNLKKLGKKLLKSDKEGNNLIKVVGIEEFSSDEIIVGVGIEANFSVSRVVWLWSLGNESLIWSASIGWGNDRFRMIESREERWTSREVGLGDEKK